MKNSDKDNFEKAWKEQFEEASIEPDEKVWAKIDAYLANREASVYKKRILFFQLLAAASLIFAIGIGYFTFYFKNTNNSKLTLVRANFNKEVTKGNLPSISSKTEALIDEPNKKEILSGSSIRNLNSENKQVSPGRENNDDLKRELVSQQSSPESINSLSLIIRHMELPVIEKPYVPLYPGFKTFDKIEVEMSDIVVREQQLWAGIDMASGVFNPNITYGARNSLFNFGGKSADMAQGPATIASGGNSNYEPEKSTFSPKMSFSYGVNMGYKIARKWILNGGLGFQFARSSTSVNKYTESTSQTERYAFGSFEQNINNTNGVMSINTSNSSIDLNNDYEFITFPFSTGYIIVDRKLKWTLNGGLATEILIKNTLYDPNNFLTSVEFRPGKNSPYNATMFSGILGTSIYLPLFKNYQLSFFPTYRFGFNYMTKESSSFNSKPSSFMLSAGMAYIFK